MLYVLAALIVTGFISGALIKMTSSDKTNTKLYATSASARSAARSGIIASTTYFCDKNNKVEVVKRLQKWADANGPADLVLTDSLIVGTPTAHAVLVPDRQSFYTELLAFDKQNMNITIRSHGFGKGGSRATIISVYHLDGFGFAEVSNWGEENALYLEDGVKLNLFAPITVNGNVRFSSATDFDAFATGSVFNGKFRVQDGSASDMMNFKGEYTFNDTAYFGTKPYWQWDGSAPGLSSINEISGFPQGSHSMQGHNATDKIVKTTVGKKSYWLDIPETEGANNSYTLFDYSSESILSSVAFDNNEMTFENYGGTTSNTALVKDSILDTLNFPRIPCRIEVHPEVIDPNFIYDVPGPKLSAVDISKINTMPTSWEWNGFLVFRITGNFTVGNATTLTRKVIFLVEGELKPNLTAEAFSVLVDTVTTPGPNLGKVIPQNSGHCTIITTAPGAIVDNWGGFDTFRGLLYRQEGTLTIGGSGNLGVKGLYGSIYGKSFPITGSDGKVVNEVKWYPKAGQNGEFTYDPTVFSDLDVTGNMVDGNNNFITKSADCNAATTTDFSKLSLIKPEIAAWLVSQSL